MGTKQIFFVSGLPRAGSTLLMNLLGQNPRFAVTATSGLLDIMFTVRNVWEQMPEFQAHPDDEAKRRVLQGILEGYYSGVPQPVVFDKSRGWLAHLEMAEHVMGQAPKVLVPVRHLPDVLASFEKLFRVTSRISQAPGEAQNYFRFQTIQGRCEYWMQGDQAVGLAYNRIRDAIARGHRAQMHFVSYERFTTNPLQTIRGIYAFLGQEPFEHDFQNVKQITWEDDGIHGYKGLHDIRSRIEPAVSQAQGILGPIAQTYRNLDFWDA